MNSESGSRRLRASALAVALVVMFSMLASVLEPALAAPLTPERVSTAALIGGQQLGATKPLLAKRTRHGVKPEIVGGTGVPQGQYTFMAFVDGGGFQCGGSLIAPTYVMTAAHCATDEGTTNEIAPGMFTVWIGKANINETGDENQWGVVDVNVHPGWDPNTFENDVAILQLDGAVPASIATPLPLVSSGATGWDGAGQSVAVSGWGDTGGGDSSDQLLETNLRLVGDAGCESVYGGEFSATVMLCATNKGKDSCYGDSGGPLFVREVIGTVARNKKAGHGHSHSHKHGHKRNNNRHKRDIPLYRETQTGIVSWGEDCADPNFPGVYTRLSAPVINDFVMQATR